MTKKGNEYTILAAVVGTPESHTIFTVDVEHLTSEFFFFYDDDEDSLSFNKIPFQEFWQKSQDKSLFPDLSKNIDTNLCSAYIIIPKIIGFDVPSGLYTEEHVHEALSSHHPIVEDLL